MLEAFPVKGKPVVGANDLTHQAAVFEGGESP